MDMKNEIPKIESTPALLGEAERKLNSLPENIIPGDKIYFDPDTNVFINDVPKFDSFCFLVKLSTPLGILDPRGKRRNIYFFEEDYLTEQLTNILVNSDIDLFSNVIVPMTGCGEYVANSLVERLYNDFNIKLEIKRPEEVGTQPAIIVDDVLKTGRTMLRELPPELLFRPNNTYAVWAMSSLSNSDYQTGTRYEPLRTLTNNGEHMFAGVVYAGAGLKSPGLGVPVNSISTLVNGNEKSNEVVKSLAEKYFGDRLYQALKEYLN